MTVPHLTRPGALPPPPPLKKIAFEEHFLEAIRQLFDLGLEAWEKAHKRGTK